MMTISEKLEYQLALSDTLYSDCRVHPTEYDIIRKQILIDLEDILKSESLINYIRDKGFYLKSTYISNGEIWVCLLNNTINDQSVSLDRFVNELVGVDFRRIETINSIIND